MSNHSSDSDSPGIRPFMMGRRQFLILGSAAAVGFAVRDVTAATLTESAAGSLAVAYIDGEPDDVWRAPVIRAAEAIPTGDPRFLSRDAKVRVLGLWRQDAAKPMTITLTAFYPTSLAIGGKAPYFGWHHNAFEPFGSRGFTIPVTDEGLQMMVDHGAPSALTSALSRRRTADADFTPRTATDIASASNALTLKLGHESDAMKLQPGRYVVALLAPGAPKPDWSSFRYDSSGSQGPLRASAILGDDAVPFDYFVIRIELAS